MDRDLEWSRGKQYSIPSFPRERSDGGRKKAARMQKKKAGSRDAKEIKIIAIR